MSAARWASAAASLCALLAAAPAASAADPPAATPAACRERVAIECVHIDVPVDRSGGAPGTVHLYVERLGDDRRKSRALLFLAGGPGQAATPLVPGVAPALANVLDDRDVLILDQRGTGRSGPLSCKAARGATEHARVAACARLLGPARNGYATADSVADIEDVRSALGIDKLTLYGTSYGTKVALDYAAAHPAHVESLVLDSVVPGGPVEPFGRSTWRALPRILGQLCAGSRCRGITSDPLGDLVAVERRLANAHPRVARITSHGKLLAGRIAPGSVVDLLYAGDFWPQMRAATPAAVHAAARGDLAPLTRLVERAYGFSTASYADDPLFVATTCADDAFPWSPGAARAVRAAAARRAVARLPRSVTLGLPASTLLGFSSFDSCVDWPATPSPAVRAPVPDVPALVVSGGDDLRTPTEDARAVARTLPRSRLLVISGTGHSVIGDTVKDCPGRALLGFLRGTPFKDCPRENVPAPVRLAPRRLADAHRWPRLGRAAGRILRATIATLTDVRADADLAGLGPQGGLRRGWFAVGFDGLRLHGVVSVSGLAVSGLLQGGGTSKLTVRAGVTRGTLRVRPGLITGTIGRARIRARLRG